MNLFLIMGTSGSGKSTLEQSLVRLPQFKKIVSSTTRAMRAGEVEGEDYYYITEEKFRNQLLNNEFLQITNFAGTNYGSLKSEYKSDQHLILVVVPSAAKKLIDLIKRDKMDITPVIVTFDVTDSQIRKNMKKRGDSTTMINKRLIADDISKQLRDSGLKSDITYEDKDLTEDFEIKVLQWIDHEDK